MAYRVISSNHISVLVDKVNKSIQKGWTPQGGISVTSHRNGSFFCQAMIKPEEGDKVIDMYPKYKLGKGSNVLLASIN